MENKTDDQRGESFAASPGSANDVKLTAAQIAFWRRAFPELLMTDEMVQTLRDNLQRRIGSGDSPNA